MTKKTEKDIKVANIGDMIDETTLPESIVKRGGGWLSVQGRDGQFYVCTGCHNDGLVGFKLLEVRTGGWF